MKIKQGFVVREIAGECVVVALGEASKIFNGIIKLNETGKIIWEQLSLGSDKDTVVEKILSEYEVDRATVEADFDRFVETLQGANILE
ncbi:MAG: PqqD family protein [Ruminococcaceae bacterium]|nr:PqqD family protein [Oscillospiraceae bacterium]